jgi:hypothetical protein
VFGGFDGLTAGGFDGLAAGKVRTRGGVRSTVGERRMARAPFAGFGGLSFPPLLAIRMGRVGGSVLF